MKPMPFQKYRPTPPVGLKNRVWPDRMITQAPRWCSVDLRDGNQALILPMNLAEKTEFFRLLVKIGFPEIEVGFPSASQVEFDFCRKLIEEELIPEGVSIQVLVQAREHLIHRTFEALRGAPQVIVHLYNSTSALQRRVVFGKSRDEIKKIAVDGARLVREGAEALKGTRVTYEYSPESFMGTELDYALEVSEAVLDVWQPTPERKAILNLPNTVEQAGPDHYADQIEAMARGLRRRDSVLISLHTHNDRGCGVAAAELGLKAGADRVEGTLFGNGERTGNLDVITLALNLFSQGVDPRLDLSDINEVIEVASRLTRLPVHPRHPYAGELVYTAFSGSHQDAINKGMRLMEEARLSARMAPAGGAPAGNPPAWEVPYLPIDPQDVGRSYEGIIRINSQSGKGGVAWVMENEFGYLLPKGMHPEFGSVIQKISDHTGKEVLPDDIWAAFEKEYLLKKAPFDVKSLHVTRDGSEGESTEIEAFLHLPTGAVKAQGRGNGPIDAFVHALTQNGVKPFRLTAYHQHALSSGSDSRAAAFVSIETARGETHWGVGVDPNTTLASVKAVLSALNRAAG